MPTLTRVTFKVKADLDIGQNIRLTGDNRSLGSFSPNRGLDLVTTPLEYPIWRTNRPVNLPTGIPLSYKYVIVSGGLFHGWEPITAHARIVVPAGAEMEVVDEVGVYSEETHNANLAEMAGGSPNSLQGGSPRLASSLSNSRLQLVPQHQQQQPQQHLHHDPDQVAPGPQWTEAGRMAGAGAAAGGDDAPAPPGELPLPPPIESLGKPRDGRSSAPSSEPASSLSRSKRAGRRPNVHPHVRFQIDEPEPHAAAPAAAADVDPGHGESAEMSSMSTATTATTTTRPSSEALTALPPPVPPIAVRGLHSADAAGAGLGPAFAAIGPGPAFVAAAQRLGGGRRLRRSQTDERSPDDRSRGPRSPVSPPSAGGWAADAPSGAPSPIATDSGSAQGQGSTPEASAPSLAPRGGAQGVADGASDASAKPLHEDHNSPAVVAASDGAMAAGTPSTSAASGEVQPVEEECALQEDGNRRGRASSLPIELITGTAATRASTSDSDTETDSSNTAHEVDVEALGDDGPSAGLQTSDPADNSGPSQHATQPRVGEAGFRHPGVHHGTQRLKTYRMFLVSYNLPVILHLDRSKPPGKRWSAEWNPNSISRKSEGSVANDHTVIWVGAITPYVLRDADIQLVWKLDDADREEITKRVKAFDCVPIFLEKEVFVDHYIRCCMQRIRDIFHNVLNVNLPSEETRRLEREYASNRTGEPSKESEHAAAEAKCMSHKRRDRWGGFVTGCNLFADVIMKLVMEKVTDRDLVWVHNYPLMLLPQLLRARALELGLPAKMQPKIVFFLHTPFPTSEIFRTLSVRNELLEGVLGANVVGFHTFDHARHFITSCKRFLGLQFHSQQGGRLVVDHMDRAVLIAISHVGIERHLLDTAVMSRQCRAEAEAIRRKYRDKTIIVGMDELTRLKGVPLKLLAFERLLAEVPYYRNKVVFIQHGLHTLQHQLTRMAEAELLGVPLLEQELAIQREVVEVKELCERINRVYGPVVIFKEYGPHEWPSVESRAAIWQAADIMVCTPVMEGLNLLPLEYAFCHREPAGVVIMSEFSAASRVLNGAIRINCYDMEEISRAYDQALCMNADERNARRDRDCGYITNRSSATWTRNIILDVEAGIQGDLQAITALDKDIIQGSEYHSVVSFENIVLEGFCQPLLGSDVLEKYTKCSKRLILLDYAGTLAPRELGNLAVKRDFLGVSKRKLSPKISAILKLLCSDPRNVVFVISGNSTQVLSLAFAEILSDPSTPLGLVAHSGVMVRWGNVLKRGMASSAHRDDVAMRWGRARSLIENAEVEQTEDEWEYMLPGVAQEWSRWIDAAEIPSILDEYTWRTGGSSWRQTEVTTSWQFRQADPEWGGIQAVALQHELEEAIANVNVPIAVTRKKHTVELLPKGVDKGKAVKHILEELRRHTGFVPAFCFCAGDDTSDEPMYASVLDFMGSRTAHPEDDDGQERFGHAFTCTVGRKPTAAQYYVNDTEQVLEVIQSLSTAVVPAGHSAPPPGPLAGAVSK